MELSGYGIDLSPGTGSKRVIYSFGGLNYQKLHRGLSLR
ncbi:unnamed protein product [Acidithrix sp. C25]|nr:unnamed protein product [Acidithrix sp. C25]